MFSEVLDELRNDYDTALMEIVINIVNCFLMSHIVFLCPNWHLLLYSCYKLCGRVVIVNIPNLWS